MDGVKITFCDHRSPDQAKPVVFSEELAIRDLKSLQQTISSIQTKMNDWLTAEIEKERGTNPAQCGDGITTIQADDEDDDDDEEDDDGEDSSEPPAKQKKT